MVKVEKDLTWSIFALPSIFGGGRSRKRAQKLQVHIFFGDFPGCLVYFVFPSDKTALVKYGPSGPLEICAVV